MTIAIHATTLTVAGHGVVLRGPSGSGKSDLALRLLDDARRDVRLVADDYTCLHPRDGVLYAVAPAATAGYVEARGLGVLRLPDDRLETGPTMVRLCLDLTPGGGVERLPDPAVAVLLPGHAVPLFRLDPFQAAAPAKVRLAVGLIVGDILPAP